MATLGSKFRLTLVGSSSHNNLLGSQFSVLLCEVFKLRRVVLADSLEKTRSTSRMTDIIEGIVSFSFLFHPYQEALRIDSRVMVAHHIVVHSLLRGVPDPIRRVPVWGVFKVLAPGTVIRSPTFCISLLMKP